MSRFRLELARPEDDAALRRAIAAAPMEGEIALSFRREPSFFDAAVVDGHFRQVMVGRDSAAEDRIAGLGSRSIRSCHVNGAPATVGYLSLLRVLPEYRGQGRLLANAYAYFRDLHADGRAKLYLTTIAEENLSAKRNLTGGRAGLPQYHFAGRFLTAAIPLSRRTRTPQAVHGDLTITQGSAGDLDAIFDFLHREGPVRQFFPDYERDDFFNTGGPLRGLRLQDILLARRGGRIVGTLGGWDQRAFRQVSVAGYGRKLRMARPFYNGWARLRGLPRLPAPGDSIRQVLAAIPLVAAEENGAEVFGALLSEMLAMKAGGAADYFMLGLHESDPLSHALQSPGATRYATNLYNVCWADGEALRASLDARPPYLELGSL